jgi:hypothetical protein
MNKNSGQVNQRSQVKIGAEGGGGEDTNNIVL